MSQALLQRAVESARQAEARQDPAALSLWEGVVRMDPSHFVAWSKIGVLQALAGDVSRSIAAFECAARAAPFHAALHFNLGRAYFSGNRPQDAVQAYRAALQLAPSYTDAYFGWLEALGGSAPATELLAVCEAAVASGIHHPRLCAEQARQLLRLRRYQEALNVVDTAVQRTSDDPVLHELRAAALIELGLPEEALLAAQRALDLMPQSKDAELSRVAALIALDDNASALTALDRLEASSGDDTDLLRMRGIALAKASRFTEAVPLLTEAGNRDGNHVALWEALGTALGAMHQPAAAAECFARVDRILVDTRIQSTHRLRALNQRLNYLSEALLFNESVACCDQLGELTEQAGFVVARRTYALAMLADWQRLPAARGELRVVASRRRGDCSPFGLFAFFDDPALHLDYAKSHTQIGWGAVKLERPRPRVRSGAAPLRVGYMSPDFRDHPVGRLMVSLLENHNRTLIEPVALSTWLQPKEFPETDITARIRAATAEYIELAEMNDHKAAERIRAADLDVIVDLCGHTLGARPGVLARGCAPWQIQYLGFPGSTGADFFDAVIADRHVIPHNAEHFFVERVIRLPVSYLPPGDRPAVRVAQSRADLGLPDQAVVLGAFHSTYKISPEVFDCWAYLMRACPEAVLWLNIHDAPARTALAQHAEARGVASHRLIFADREADISRHLSRMTHIDLMLDTYPYGSHSAALDALWAGVPILACEGRSFASRVCGGLLKELGLASLVTSSLEAYTARGLELLNDPAERTALKQHLLEQRSHPVFNAKAHAEHLETTLLQFVLEQEALASDA